MERPYRRPSQSYCRSISINNMVSATAEQQNCLSAPLSCFKTSKSFKNLNLDFKNTFYVILSSLQKRSFTISHVIHVRFNPNDPKWKMMMKKLWFMLQLEINVWKMTTKTIFFRAVLQEQCMTINDTSLDVCVWRRKRIWTWATMWHLSNFN